MVPAAGQELVALVILGVAAGVVYRLALWMMAANRTADPWGDEVNQALDQEDAVPLCHHCFTPQQHDGWFCPECGATVGPYSNCLPFVYVFSQGEVVRAGVNERIRRGPLVVVGLVLLSISMCAVAAPFYWFFLFKHLRCRGSAGAESGLGGG